MKKLLDGWKINFVSGVDCTGINLDSQDLGKRRDMIVGTSRAIAR